MQEQNDIRDILNQALQALNSKDNKTHYLDLHDDFLITHGIPGNFPSDKEGLKTYYNEIWQAFPDAKYSFDHVIVEGSEAACMFSMIGIQKGNLMGIPPSDKPVRVDGMIFFHFKGSKIGERWKVIDILSAVKQLGIRQQFSAIKNAILEYGEVKVLRLYQQ